LTDLGFKTEGSERPKITQEKYDRSSTLTSADAHRLGVVVNNQPRRITPRECARLQGFPDWYQLHPDEYAAYRQLGNAVTVPVVKTLMLDYFRNNVSHFKFSRLLASGIIGADNLKSKI
jgi:DNA (cytosine-5)-methyltransferase 1